MGEWVNSTNTSRWPSLVTYNSSLATRHFPVIMETAMATQTSPRRPVSKAGLGIGVVIAAGLGVGIPYGMSNYTSTSSEPKPEPRTAAPPAAPPKIEFLGAAKMQGASASLATDPKQ